MAHHSPDRSPVDDSINIDPDKEARMLLNPPSDSVQFTSNQNQSRDPTNGQVLLSPGSGPASNSAIRNGVGMTKQELMKYANDPFWVRLRTFLFILFWVIWFAMLIGSVVIVAMAPGCPATASLPWWKKSSMIEVDIGDIAPNTDRSAYAQEAVKKIGQVKSNLPGLADMNVNTIVVKSFDPYILMEQPDDDNATKANIKQLQQEINSLAKNPEEIKVILDLKLEQTPESFNWYNASKNNQTEYEDAYIWSTNKPNTPAYKYDVDRLQYVALSPKGNPLLNYASPKVRQLMKDSILEWMKTKIEGIQTSAIWNQDEPNGNISKSKEAELDLLKAVKMAGQNKVLLNSDQELSEDAFEEGEEKASFDMAPDPSFWKRLSDQFKMKDSFNKIFEPYVKQEEQVMSEQNKTDQDILVTRENVGKHWRTYQIQHPSDPLNAIAQQSDVAMAEAAAMAMYMLPRVTPVVKLDLSRENLDSLNSKSDVINSMMKLREQNPETFLAGRTIMPKVPDQVFAIYRGAKKENGYLLLVNGGDQEQTVNVDSSQLPYQDEIQSKKVALVNSASPKQAIGQDVDLANIKLAPKQSMLIQFHIA